MYWHGLNGFSVANQRKKQRVNPIDTCDAYVDALVRFSVNKTCAMTGTEPRLETPATGIELCELNNKIDAAALYQSVWNDQSLAVCCAVPQNRIEFGCKFSVYLKRSVPTMSTYHCKHCFGSNRSQTDTKTQTPEENHTNHHQKDSEEDRKESLWAETQEIKRRKGNPGHSVEGKKSLYYLKCATESNASVQCQLQEFREAVLYRSSHMFY